VASQRAWLRRAGDLIVSTVPTGSPQFLNPINLLSFD
jgi:hypothetical protein